MLQLHSPLKYIGGKHLSAHNIIALFPPDNEYEMYVEPCLGAAHVFMAKPKKHKEIVNDKDGNVIAFWRSVQAHADIMQERLENLPYSREIYYEYYRSLFDGSELDTLERGIRWFYALRGTGTGWMRKSPVGWNHNGASSYYNAVDMFKDVQSRFKGVAIDNRDIIATIKRYDAPKVLYYIDPPYFGGEWYYQASKDGFPHEEMAEILQSVKGYVALSYYPHPDIDRLYPPEKWHRTTWSQHKSSDIKNGEPAIATEMLLTNYDVSRTNQAALF